MMESKPGYRIHAQIIEQIKRDIAKEEQLTTVQSLTSEFPVESIEIKEVDIKYKVRLLKEELQRSFPAVKFTVKGEHYSGGCSIDVLCVDGPNTDKVRAIADKYQYTYPDNDSSTDYFHVDNYCHTQRKITKWNERMQEAIRELKSTWHGLSNTEIELKAQQGLWAKDLPVSDRTYDNASES
jgi:hypothetical protein